MKKKRRSRSKRKEWNEFNVELFQRVFAVYRSKRIVRKLKEEMEQEINLYMLKEQKALCLQCFFRRILAQSRMKRWKRLKYWELKKFLENEKFQIETKAALKIQKSWRMYIARREIDETESEMTDEEYDDLPVDNIGKNLVLATSSSFRISPSDENIKVVRTLSELGIPEVIVSDYAKSRVTHCGDGILLKLDQNEPLFKQIKTLFQNSMIVGNGIEAYVHNILMVENRKLKQRFLESEEHLHTHHQHRPNFLFNNLQRRYRDTIGKLMENDHVNKSRKSNITIAWHRIDGEEKDIVAENGLLFRLQERKSKPNLGYFGSSLQLTKLPRTPDLYENTQFNLDNRRLFTDDSTHFHLVLAYTCLGNIFPLTHVVYEGPKMEGYDSHYVLVKRKKAEPSFCRSWNDYRKVLDEEQLFPIDENEVEEADELIVDERATLPRFIVEYSLEQAGDVLRKLSPYLEISNRSDLKEVFTTNVQKSTVFNYFHEIQQAAIYGEKITLLKGRHRSNGLMLNKKHVICGNARDNSILELSSHLVLYNSIQNISIVNQDPLNKDNTTIFLCGEKAILHNCNIENINIVVDNYETERIIANCSVRGNAYIKASGRAQLTIQQSSILCIRGIQASENAMVTLIDNKHQSDDGNPCLRARENSTVQILQETTFSSCETAVRMTNDSHLICKNSKFENVLSCCVSCIHSSKFSISDCIFTNSSDAVGIRVKSNSSGEISKNDFRNLKDGIATESAQIKGLQVQGNHFTNMKDCAILLASTQIIENNQFVDSKYSIVVTKGTSSIQGNTFTNACLYVKEQSSPQISNNTFTTTVKEESCVVISDSSTPLLLENTIVAPNGHAILINESANPKIESNQLQGSHICIGLCLLASTSNPICIRKNILQNSTYGIVCDLNSDDEIPEEKNFASFHQKSTDQESNVQEGTIEPIISSEILHAHLEENQYSQIKESCILLKARFAMKTVKDRFEDSNDAIISVGKSFLYSEGNFFKKLHRCIVVSGDGQAVIEKDNEFTCSKFGIVFWDRADVTIASNIFYNMNEEALVQSYGKTTGLIKRNQFLVERVTLQIGGESKIEVCHNIFSSCEHTSHKESVSIQTFEDCEAFIHHNDFQSTENNPKIFYGIVCTNDCHVEISENTFSDFGYYGIYLLNNVKGKIEKNSFSEMRAIYVSGEDLPIAISHNLFSLCELGIRSVSTSQETIISENRFLHCTHGIETIGSKSMTIIESNTFIDNHKAIYCAKGTRSRLIGNSITTNSHDGIVIVNDSFPTIEQNIILAKGGFGITLSSQAEAKILNDNVISGKYGIRISDSTKAIISSNQFTNIELQAITVEDRGSCLVDKNTFNSVTRCVIITAHSPDQILIIDNTFMDSILGIGIASECTIRIESNKFKKMKRIQPPFDGSEWTSACLLANKNPNIEFRSNSFSKCHIGCSFWGVSTCTCEGNKFNETYCCFIFASIENNPEQFKISENAFNHCHSGIRTLFKTAPQISKNTFSHISTIAILACQQSRPTIFENEFTNSCIALKFEDESSAKVFRNVLTRNRSGIRASHETHGNIEGNDISNNKFGAILGGHSKWVFKFNKFNGSENAAIFTSGNADTLIQKNNFIGVHMGSCIYSSGDSSTRLIGFHEASSNEREKDTRDFTLTKELSRIKFEPTVGLSFGIEVDDENSELGFVLSDDISELSMNEFDLLTQKNTNGGDTVASTHDNSFSNEDEKNQISGKQVSIRVESRSHVSVSHVAISDSMIGLLTNDQAVVSINNCSISGNKTGIASFSNHPKNHCKNCSVQSNKVGVVIGEEAKLKLEENKIYGNMYGLKTHSFSRGIVRKNKILFNFQNTKSHPYSLSRLEENKTVSSIWCLPWYFDKLPYFIVMLIALWILHSVFISSYSAILLLACLIGFEPDADYSFSHYFSISINVLFAFFLGMLNFIPIMRIIVRKRRSRQDSILLFMKVVIFGILSLIGCVINQFALHFWNSNVLSLIFFLSGVVQMILMILITITSCCKELLYDYD